MPRQYLVPGDGFLTEDTQSQYLIVGSGFANATSPSGAGSGTGGIDSITLSAPSATASIGDSGSSSLASVTLTTVTGSASANDSASSSLSDVTLTTVAGSASSTGTASGSIDGINLTAPSGSSSTGDTGSGSLGDITLSAPNGTGAGTSNASGSGSIDSITLTVISASTPIGDQGISSLSDVTLTTITATASANDDGLGSIDSITLSAPNGVAGGATNGTGSGSLDPVDVSELSDNAGITAQSQDNVLVSKSQYLVPGFGINNDETTNAQFLVPGYGFQGNIGTDSFPSHAVRIQAPNVIAIADNGTNGFGEGDITPITLTTTDGIASTGTNSTGAGSIDDITLTSVSGTALGESNGTGSGSIDGITLVAPQAIPGFGSLNPNVTLDSVTISEVTATVTKDNPTHKTIIWQYENSPIIKQIVNDFAIVMDTNVLTNNFIKLIWDVRTANSFGLDILGRIVGVGRYLSLTDNEYFGFEPDYTPFDDKPFFHGSAITSQLKLSDELYRKVILAKAANNICGASIPAIENVLNLLFGDKGKCAVRIDGQLQLTYLFYFTPEPIDLAIIQTAGLLPQPIGHTVTKTFV